jgi:cellulose synthase operon protein C
MGALCAAASPAEVEWILDDALKEEYVSVNQTSVVMPEDFTRAMEFYAAGNYQVAVRVLENERNLNLPDNRLDFVYFALGECYRQLKLKDLAQESYRYVTVNFPQSDKTSASYFRLLQYACADRDSLLADTIMTLFQRNYQSSPLFYPVLYLTARLRYSQNRYDEVMQILSRIPERSFFYQDAQFLKALCLLQKKDWEKALITLDYVRKNTARPELAAEACILIADAYFNKGSYATALSYYKNVPRAAKRYNYTIVKTARSYLEAGQYARARDIATSFIQNNQASEYFFEMVSILEQAYGKLNDKANTERMKNLIFRQLKNARLSFEIYEELSRVADMVRVWQVIEFGALQKKNEALRSMARQSIGRLDNLAGRYRELLFDIGLISSKKEGENIPGLAERRYLDLLTQRADRLHDTLAAAGKKLDALQAKASAGQTDSLVGKRAAEAAKVVDSVKAHLAGVNHEHQLVMRECLDEIQGRRQADENIQAKFVDWAFLKYQDKKAELARLTKEVLAKEQKKAAPDSLTQKGSDVVKLFTAIDINKLNSSLLEDRSMLLNHILGMLYVYPQSRYTPQLLFRLAELYFDQASDDFDVKLRAYEKRMAEAKDTAKLAFPEYDLTKVIDTYDKIIRDYPSGETADDAFFYKALSLQKLGEVEKANDVLVELTNRYPESEYYVEANMNVARYYFEHPKIQGGKGYKLAEETYHKVLYFRDHPQFVQALYSLGWCYYMEDQYDEAIAVFKYLVEEVALDFDVTRMDEKKQVSNPLLRDEAIDYIAISFDEENRIDDAVKFLQLIGNVDYAAMVLKRVAELRVEDMDYPAAVKAYQRLLQEYPQSIVSPDASVSLIKVYELMNQPDNAMKEREEFFTRYCRGGQWQQVVWKRDSLLVPRIDSTAISIGLYLSDASYRAADQKKDPAGFAAAAKYYRALVEKYPDDKRASEALWNLAVILDTKVNQSGDAYAEYLKFSTLKSADDQRREQAALNAISIAQRLLPPDTAAEEGKLEGPALKVIEACNNYRQIFPKGKSLATVQLSEASIYFNRKMYANASEFYEAITLEQSSGEEYYEAMFLLGQCHFGKENWDLASAAFNKVWKGTTDPSRRSRAYKLLLQAEFSSAKQAFATGAYQKAGELFAGIDQKYPGSEYGDIVLFKSAESYEKIEDWQRACDSYLRLAKSYPQSKLAPSALFNAATDYEKANKYEKSAETYELLVSTYPQSDKAKDGLFNLGLAYEKLGKLDKMAEANERYTQLYPGEKDVEAMLLRSAQYYYKANMFDKATTAYRSFIRRFPQSPKVIEALFMIGKMFLEKMDRDNAVLSFSQAEQLNARLAAAKLERNDYYASEAAYYIANMKREDFVAVKFVLPDAKFKADQKLKASLLAEATKAYEKVVQYQSERMFEAAYRIGQMYEDFTDAWTKQERPKLQPIKQAVLEKDIVQVASSLLQKSFAPYKKALELAGKFDSLGAEQKIWVLKVKVSLAKNFFAAGQCLEDVVAAMQNAPIPPEIKNKPLYYYQYLKQLLETIDPMKAAARNYMLGAVKQLDSLGLKGENSAKCLSEFCRLNYLTGNEYDRLAEKILREPEIPKEFTAAEREELSFQLEDIVYELQDKAIAAYEEAMNLAKKENLTNEWYGKIMLALAKLSPEKYGARVFARNVLTSSGQWRVRTDSVAGWNSKDIPLDGWRQASEAKGFSVQIKQTPVAYLWDQDTAAKTVFLWKHVFLAGQPRDAQVFLMACGKYWLYVNGALTASDTVGKRSPQKLDSIVGVQSLFKGGDNDISLHVLAGDSSYKGCALFFSSLLDTSQHFTPSGKYGPEPVVAAAQEQPPADTSKSGGREVAPKAAEAKQAATAPEAAAPAPKMPAFDKQFKNRGELLRAIVDYQKKEELTQSEIKKERLEVQKLRIKNEDMDEQIRKVKEETALLKKSLEEMHREK